MRSSSVSWRSRNLWLAQHRLLRDVVASNGILLRLLVLSTLNIVVLPFPTALVAQGATGEQAVTRILYVGTMGVSGTVLAQICVAIARDPTIRDSDEPLDQTHAWAMVAAFAVTHRGDAGVPGALALVDGAARRAGSRGRYLAPSAPLPRRGSA